MMKLTTQNFRGSWAGLPVAWTAKNQFDEQIYRGDVARCCVLGVPGVYTGGTTGEFYAMEFDEFQRVARATVEEAHAAGKPAMIGVSSTYTLGAARRAAYAAELGADAIQVALPFWMEVPDSEVLGFFREVSAAAGHIPLSVYETRRTKKALTLEQHRAIKSELPNYLMVKSNSETLGVTESGCVALTQLGINVFGDEGSLWPKLGPHGLAGCCSSFVYYAPDIVLPLNQDLAARNWKQLAVGAVKLQRLLDFVLTQFAPRGYLDSAIDRLGGIAGGVLRTSLYCRGPYPHASEDDVRALREWHRQNLPEVFAGIETKLALP
jgi:dihydrodipicolinate synthase/N-acetylneuraminate lyase